MSTTPFWLHGKLAWMEANTPLCHQAQRFYADLFCWETHPVHVYPFGILPTFSTGGAVFGHVFMAMGMFARSQWLLFISADIEKCIEKVEGLGGSIIAKRQEYPGWSTTASVADPNGTSLNLIKLDAGDVADPSPYGAPITFELWTPQLEKVKNFYADLFEGELVSTQRGYTLVIDGISRFHLKALEGADHPAVWVPFFRTRSVGADERRAITFGAIPRTKQEALGDFGTASIFVDPVGSFFGLVSET